MGEENKVNDGNHPKISAFAGGWKMNDHEATLLTISLKTGWGRWR